MLPNSLEFDWMVSNGPLTPSKYGVGSQVMKPLIYDVIFTRIHARLLIVLSSLFATILALFGPYFQKLFVDAITGQPETLAFGLSAGPLAFIVLAFVSVFISQIFFQLANYLGMRESVHMQSVF